MTLEEKYKKLLLFAKSISCNTTYVHTKECSERDAYGSMDLCEITSQVLKEIGEM